MPTEASEQNASAGTWSAKQVYTMSVLCLVVGIAVGYLFRGSQSTVPASDTKAAMAQKATAPSPMPSLADMKHMADTKAQPLLEKLKSDPNNTDVLFQVGNIYKATHQFKEAVTYYDRALQVAPKNVAIRTELASCMYYTGDVDGALGQLQQCLRDDPKDANSLFNLGLIKWQAKKDANGALASWHKLLQSNPQLSAARKADVQKLIADVEKQKSAKF
ncbi:MAG TPA: tetratricopeptide repeat protein [Terriglobales bacterium]|nr:tetratricopeptide repeat protein [Terriglobales bacterium]